ncbi:hypothetical protein MMC10_001106 [Thelotrema lepadinum]|nr:hypothetical protein [Thelotrema lepadinum]
MESTSEQKRPVYPLKRTLKSSIRLNYNHLLMKGVAGYLINPRIPIRGEDIRIADVGTGTAAWALEVATTFPMAQVHGFDVSDEQFSPLYNIKNVTLSVHDAFEPFPPEFVGHFDIVHVRFFLCLVNDAVAPALVENLTTLLKPTGYIQWFELDALATRVFKSNPSLSTPSLDQHCSGWKKPHERAAYNWVSKLPDLYRSAGLEVIAKDDHPITDQYRYMWGLSSLFTYEDVVDESPLGIEKAEEQRQFVNRLEAEMKQGAGFDTNFICVIGRRPLA